PSLRDDCGAGGGPLASMRVRRALILAQVAFGVLLLTSAGLFVRTLWNLRHLDTGIDRAHVLLFNVFGEGLDTGTVMSKNQRRVEVQQRIAAIPGVRAATLSVLGGFAAGVTAPVIIEDRPPVLDPPRALENHVTASYFETLGLPIVRGRTWSAE